MQFINRPVSVKSWNQIDSHLDAIDLAMAQLL